MQPVSLILLGVFALNQTCSGGQAAQIPFLIPQDTVFEEKAADPYILESGQDIAHRFPVPEGYERIPAENNSFSAFLRSLPLQPHGSPVRYFNGEIRPNIGSYVAVVDWETGDRDLQQCADAVIRIRATYLYQLGRYDDIRFHFGNGFLAEYSKWRAGNRIAVDGNSVYWRPARSRSDTDESFWDYLQMVFAYASTASLVRELKAVPIEQMQIGDVFLQPGFPGHAAMVVDMAYSPATGSRIFLLAQSYMPAQDIHVLNNLQGQELGPWYRLDFEGDLSTPSWTFAKEHLKRFKE